MAEHEVQVHEVQFLAATNAKVGDEPVVIITIRPDLPSSYRPHKLGIPRSQAERLLADLKTILSRSTVWLVLLVLGFAGCSSSVEVERETTSSRPEAAVDPEVLTSERSRTAVAVDLFQEQGPVVMEDGRLVEVPPDGVLVVEGCVHFHEHLHVYLNDGDRNSERVALEIVREWSNGDCRRSRRD